MKETENKTVQPIKQNYTFFKNCNNKGRLLNIVFFAFFQDGLIFNNMQIYLIKIKKFREPC